MIVDDVRIQTGAIYVQRTFLVRPSNYCNKSLLQFTHSIQLPEEIQILKLTGTEIE